MAFANVSHPCGDSRGWVAQKRGVGYRRFASQLKAAHWIAGRLGVSVTSLRIPGVGVQGVNLTVPKHTGVSYSRGRWIAHAKGEGLRALFPGARGSSCSCQSLACGREGVETRQGFQTTLRSVCPVLPTLSSMSMCLDITKTWLLWRRTPRTCSGRLLERSRVSSMCRYVYYI